MESSETETIKTNNPNSQIDRGYFTSPRATGWYFPGELTERPRLSDPEGEAPFPSEAELVKMIAQGMRAHSHAAKHPSETSRDK